MTLNLLCTADASFTDLDVLFENIKLLFYYFAGFGNSCRIFTFYFHSDLSYEHFLCGILHLVNFEQNV